VILPDLSIEVYERDYKTLFAMYGVFPSFLITPKTSKERIFKTARLCARSFVYLVSNNATTGGEQKFGPNQLERYAEIKELCGNTPLFVGFGIQSKNDVQAVQSAVDGAIIGSAYLKSENREKFLDEVV